MSELLKKHVGEYITLMVDGITYDGKITFEENGNQYYLKRNDGDKMINIPHEGPREVQLIDGMFIVKNRIGLTEKIY